MQDSKMNGVFMFEMKPNKNTVRLDGSTSFKIRNAWVEHSWKYECINNKAVVRKDSLLQLVIDPLYGGANDTVCYWLMELDYSTGSALGGGNILNFSYQGQNAVMLAVVKGKGMSVINENAAIDTLVFTK